MKQKFNVTGMTCSVPRETDFTGAPFSSAQAE